MNTPILSGNESFTFRCKPECFTIKDFWAWDSSNLLSNTLRGALAEFVVAKALSIPLLTSRNDWTDYDLLYNNCCRIEVKSAAYLQAWEQHKFSEIRFSVAPARSWTSEQRYDDNLMRHSDIYVFSLYGCKDRRIANPLCLDHWVFYVLNTETINRKLHEQKSISLKSLLELHPLEANYIELKNRIDSLWPIMRK